MMVRRLMVAGCLLLMTAAPASLARAESDAGSYRAALAAAMAGDWNGTQREASRGHDAALRTAVQWIAILRGGGSFADDTAFMAQHSDWPNQTTVQERAEEASAGAPDDAVARALARCSIRRSPRPASCGSPDLVARSRSRLAGATSLIRDLWIRGNFSKFDEKSLLQRYHSMLRPADHVARLDRLLWDGQEEQARRLYPLVSPDYVALAQARLALADLDSGGDRLVARVPAELQRDPGLTYERVRWRRRKEHYDEAIPLLPTAPKDATHADAWSVEREVLARFALAEGHAETAYKIAANHEATTGAHFSELEFLAGWIALRSLHRPDLAYDHFVRLYDGVKMPISVARGAYWSARAAEAMGYNQLAEAWYSTAAERITTYYGQLAAAHIGAPGAARIVEPRPRKDEIAAFNAGELVRATRGLAELGADEYVRRLVRQLSDHARTPVDYALIARLATDLDRPDLAVAAAKDASYAGVTLLADGYPIAGAARRRLDRAPARAAPMTRQESAFDHDAVSSAGARGLMQLMPATAKRMASLLQMRFSLPRLTSDVRYNLTLGREYLRGLLDNFSGSYVLAVAAYNAGPGRVHDWMQDFGDPRAANVDVIDWIESIPISETRNYVQRVLENLQIYRFRLGDRRLAFSLASDLRR